MIIQLRGTSGSGKSHAVRTLLDAAEQKLRVREKGRRQPLGYVVDGLTRPMFHVLGHYETACGGCDTIPSMDRIYGLAAQAAQQTGEHVLFEGLLASEEVRRSKEMHDMFGDQYRVILLDTPIELCLEGIQARRDARGDTRPLDPGNTTRRVGVISRACDRLREHGAYVARTDRAGALDLVRSWLSTESRYG